MVGLKSISLSDIKQVKTVTVEGNRVYFPPHSVLPGSIPGRASLWFWFCYFQIDELTGGKEWERFFFPAFKMINEGGHIGVTFIKYNAETYTLTNYYYLSYKEVLKIMELQRIPIPTKYDILDHGDVARIINVDIREVQLMCLGGEPCIVAKRRKRLLTPGRSHVDVPGIIEVDGQRMVGSVRLLGRDGILFVGLDGHIEIYPSTTRAWRVADRYLVKIPTRR